VPALTSRRPALPAAHARTDHPGPVRPL